MPKIMLDFSLLKENPNFRMVFIARMMSILALGMMTVAVPMQIHQMTGSTLQVGMIMALDGIGMFVGLLIGGVLADKYDRRKLILFARTTCGIGFGALALNSLLAESSLVALYVLSVWDGFFGAMGMTALMASLPVIVGRENLPSAAALSMLTVRMGMVLSPAIGGLLISFGDVSWNYLAASIGTLCTLFPLFRLPSMKPSHDAPENPLLSLYEGVKFLFSNKVVGCVVVFGTLETLATAVRVMFPALALETFTGNAANAGLMYSAIPLGAMVGALTSGWVKQSQRPGMVMIYATMGTFLAIVAMGLAGNYWLFLGILVIYGYLGSVASLIQYSIVQGHTPDHLLGRVSSLWTAQDVTGDSMGAIGLGALGKVMAPAMSIFSFGLGATGVGMLMVILFRPLRRAKLFDPALAPPPEPTGSAKEATATS
ncbi:enterobactin transporter EntS [Vibrio alginolyticus]|uniref:enterobactin transporter EntS n=1 Tax=Vibrio TaxID=662 RepID=UPI000364281E|nr:MULTISPECIES: enterobactin transporter EntS [Vibrio]EGQ7844869.1 enterobactin transporter EntS [Vibrio alginolyticus]EGQ9216392.1 enterobactin transporter EntS [Vibrio alginolyticus]EGR0307178.1 enterobactin transporter EntS [Vibrio alginolyticus]EGR2352968.1 enterobactin transporter EntS [Vibrio alginolyticus]EHK5087034.1 enterobactin transporter EntS [Vibrio alginolyticus]